MKPDIHPKYRDVVFLDTQNGTSFITRSTIKTDETTSVEGVEYPLAKVEISATSHPFYTGTMTIIDTAGRVERFEKRYGRRKKKAGEAQAAPVKEAPVQEAVAEAPVEEAPAEAEEAAPVEEAAVEPEAPVEAVEEAEEAPVEEAEEAPAEDAPADQAAPAEEAE